MERKRQRAKQRIILLIVASVGFLLAFFVILELAGCLAGPSGNPIRPLRDPRGDVRDVSGLTIRDKSGEYYEQEAELIFRNRTGTTEKMNFSLIWDVAEGFDEKAVSFDRPDVAYDVAPVRGGWRRLTVRCKDMDGDGRLRARFVYPADAIAVNDDALGYYRWDLDAYMAEDIPGLDAAMTSFEDPYDCAGWIRRNIAYGNVSEEPQTAAGTFRSGKGDCDDVAILFCYMVTRRFPSMDPRVVEGWTTRGRYHANALLRTDGGWLMLDPFHPDAESGVFDFNPFVPSGRISTPFDITDADGNPVVKGGLGVAFGDATVRRTPAGDVTTMTAIPS
jgi:hypothetical protein